MIDHAPSKIVRTKTVEKSIAQGVATFARSEPLSNSNLNTNGMLHAKKTFGEDLNHREVGETDRAFGVRPGPDKYRHDSYQVSEAFERISEKLGVDTFRKLYNATIGKIAYAVGRKSFIATPIRLGLERAIENTMSLEALHVVGAIVMSVGIARDFMLHKPLQGVLWIGINAMVNLYPIMLQRCNRARMLRVLYPNREKSDSPIEGSTG